MTGTPRPLVEERATIAVLQMIVAHAGKPCPTRREIMEWTGVARRRVWTFLAKLQERGLIEIECAGPDPARPCWKVPRLRRMRVVNGTWTEWTARFHDRKPRPPGLPVSMDACDASP